LVLLGREIEPWSPDYEANALTTEPHAGVLTEPRTIGDSPASSLVVS